jgi:hypothetical protein
LLSDGHFRSSAGALKSTRVSDMRVLKRETRYKASRGSDNQGSSARSPGAVVWRSSASQLCRSGHVPKHRLFRPISIAIATWSRVADKFDKTAETSSHFVDALSRSPVHPVSTKANSTAMILIWVPSAGTSVASQASHGPTAVCRKLRPAFQYTVLQPPRGQRRRRLSPTLR